MTVPDPAELLALARRLVTEAAERAAGGVAGAVSTKSTPTDLVTAMDKAVEQLVVDGLAAARPDDAVLAEEGTERAASSGVRWVLDPIDGTVNYVYGLPAYAVSLAAEYEGAVIAGVVRNIATGEEWTAIAGGGAWKADRRLSGGHPADLATALIGTGFSYDAGMRARQAAVLAGLLPKVRDIRRFGAAAIDLCHAAEGRLDGYYEQGLKPWDGAAGGLIAAEAGLLVSGLGGRPASAAMTVAAPPVIHADLVALLIELGA